MHHHKFNPTNAIIAVTLNCNSHCVMCDIWKNKINNELLPVDYLKLPSSLRDINITGGEPFLRNDLPEIIKNIKTACPKSKIIINTNGFLPQTIKSQIKKIILIDPKIGVRLSLDGWKDTHNKIRNYPNAFELVLNSLKVLKRAEVKNLGISFTIMDSNYAELLKIFEFTKKEKIELSLTLASDSSIYFGDKKEYLRPKNQKAFNMAIKQITNKRLKEFKPKEWLRAWFDQSLLTYYLTKKRPFICDSFQNFFYLDSTGNVYTCHLKNWCLGNIKCHNFDMVWSYAQNTCYWKKIKKCNDCWMVCTAKTNIYHHIITVILQTLLFKVKKLYEK